jgi:hypothetical protein
MTDLTTPEESAAVEGPVAAQAVEETLAQELVERARSEGVELVGPGGVLTGLTKTVLETALEAEPDEHLGYPKHAVEGRNTGNSSRQRDRRSPKTSSHSSANTTRQAPSTRSYGALRSSSPPPSLIGTDTRAGGDSTPPTDSAAQASTRSSPGRPAT